MELRLLQNIDYNIYICNIRLIKNNSNGLPITLSIASVESDPSAFVATHLYTPVSSGKTSATDSRDVLFSNVIW